jgi:hypothetical protein
VPYTIHRENSVRLPQLTAAGERVWTTFVNNIHAGQDPKTAAAGAGDTKYTKLRGAPNQWEFAVGGHT